MNEIKIKKERKERRLLRTRRKILERKERMRVTVFRSNKYFYVQVIDDTLGKTVLSAHEKEVTSEGSMTKVQKAEALGKILAEKAKQMKISSVVFDKGSYRYHGRVKAFAESARKEGLAF